MEETRCSGNPREGCQAGLGILDLLLCPASPRGLLLRPCAKILTPRAWHGAGPLLWLHLCTEMVYQKTPGGTQGWVGRASPEKQ